jgi:enamine deaminase RidA (YjgF/YER057c/UK114 family)
MAQLRAITYSPGDSRGQAALPFRATRAIDPNSGRAIHTGNVVDQTEYVYDTVLRVVATAGGSAENLVKTIEYVTPAALACYREVAGVRIRILRDPLPASTRVACETLLRPEYEIEVDAVAILD